MNDEKAGAAYVELSVRNKMKAGLDEASNRLSKFMSGLSAFTGGLVGSLAGMGVAGIVAQMENILGTADQIADSSAKIGMSAEAYQELSHAAEQSGTSIEETSNAIGKFSVLIGKAELGNKKAAETLAKYGLSLDKLKGMTPEQKLQTVADVIASMPDQATQAAAAMELMGKSAVGLVPLLAGGSQGITALRERARALGTVISEKDIARMAALADMWELFRSNWAALRSIATTPSFQLWKNSRKPHAACSPGRLH